MRKYKVNYILSTKEVPESEIIEADRIRASWNGAVEFQVDDPNLCSEYTEDNWRTIAIRQNCNVTEVKE